MSSKKQQQQVGSSGGRRDRRNAKGLLDSAGGAIAVAVSTALSGMLAQSAEAKGGIKVEKVARGTAQFTTRGANTQIRVSDRAIINYRQFNVGANEGVQFIQPSAQSRVLNRINSGEPSRIDGRMSANGIVYLVNPSGVMFGRDSVVNVGKLYAAAANISDGDFLNGVNRFVGGLGAVVNEGSIHADAVTLVGRRVINQGEILSTTAVTMVAGDDVLVGERDGNLFVKVDTVQGLGSSTGNAASTEGPAVRMGAGDMFSVAVYNEGKVRAKKITAQSGPGGATIVSGALDASSRKAGEKGGTVKVLGDKVALAGATVDASGPAGGGTVLVGGDFQGKGGVPTASRTVVTRDSTIKADATENGAGGKVVVWADGATSFGGTISARGGAAGGDGGNVEVSGKQTLSFTGGVDTTAPAGKTGSLLLDPDSINITAGAADSIPGDLTVIDGILTAKDGDSATSVITAGKLESLANSAHVTLTAGLEITADAAVTSLSLKQDAAGSVTLDAGQIVLPVTTISTQGAPVTLTAATKLEIGGIATNAGAAATGGAVTLTLTGVGTLKSGTITTAGTAAGGNVTATAPLATDAAAITLGAVNAGVGATAGDVTVSSSSGGVALQQIAGKAVNVSASADIIGAGTITGASVKLASSNGSIGDFSTAVPTPVQVDSTAGVIAEAKENVAISDPAGTMTLDHVTAGKAAFVTAADGDLLTSSATGVTNAVKAGTKGTLTSAGKIGAGAGLPLVVDAKEADVNATTDLHVKLVQLATGAVVASAGDAASPGKYTVEVKGGESQDYHLTYAKAKDLTLVVPGSLTTDTSTTPPPPFPVIVANVLTLDAASIGTSGSKLLIDAAELKASAGGVFIQDAGTLALQSVKATSGDVVIDVVKGNLTIKDEVTGQDVTLAAGHDIVYAAGVKRVTGDNVILDAGTDTGLLPGDDAKVGAEGTPVLTDAKTLKLTSHHGTNQADAGVYASNLKGMDLQANAPGKVIVKAEAGDLTVVGVTGGSVSLRADDGSVLAKAANSTVKATTTVLPTETIIDIVAKKDVGAPPAPSSTLGLLGIDASRGVVSISGESVYLKNVVASGQSGNIELTNPASPANVGFKSDAAPTYALKVTKNLTLQTDGSILDTAGQQLTLGDTIDLRSGSGGIGEALKPILTSAKAIRAEAHGTGGVYITDKSGGVVDVKGVTTDAQPIELISTLGSLKLSGDVSTRFVVAGTPQVSDVTLKAAKDITGTAGHHVIGDDVTMIAGTTGAGSVGASGAPADAIQVEAKTLTLGSADTLPDLNPGLINVKANESDGARLKLLAATAVNGPITVTTKGDLEVTHVVTSKTAVTGVVALTSTAGEITDGGDAFADVVGNKVTLVANSGIGAGNSLELGAKVIGGAGDETRTATGGIALNNDATGLIPPLPVTTSTDVWLKAGTGDVTLTQTGPVAMTLHRATTGDGDVTIENVGHWVKLDGDVTATGSGKTAKVGAGKEISRTSGTVEAAKVILAAGKNAGAAGAGGDFGIGATGARVQTKTNDLTLTSANAGDIYVENTARVPGAVVALTAATIDNPTAAAPRPAGTGNIVVKTTGTSGLVVNSVRTGQAAPPTKGRVALRATQGSITDDAVGSTSVSARELSLEAASVGVAAVPGVSPANPLDTDVLTLAAKTTGSIDVKNTSANLTIGAVVAVDDLEPATNAGLITVNSPIDLTQTHGTLSVGAPVNAGTASVFLRAVEKDTGMLVNKSQVTGRGVTLVADNMALETGSSVYSDTGILTLQTATAARPIQLGTVGEPAGTVSLNLGDSEIDTLTTKNRIEVGAPSAGPVTFTAPISLDPRPDTTLNHTLAIVTGETVNQTAPGFTAFKGDQLSISAKTGIGTTGPVFLDVNDLAATTDAGGIRARNDGDLNLTKVGEIGVVSSGSSTATPDGDVEIVSTGTMTVDTTVRAAGSVRLQADTSAATNDVIVNQLVEAGAEPNGHTDADLTIEANRHIVVNKNIRATDDVKLTTDVGDVRLHDRVDAQFGNVTIDARNAVSSDTTGDIQADKAVSVTAHARDIDLGRSVTATKLGITLTAGDAGFGNSNNDVHTGADGTLSAGGAVTLTAQDAVHTEGTIVAGAPGGGRGDILITAVANDILIEKALSARNGGDIRASAKLDLETNPAARLTADHDVRLRTSDGDLTTGGFVDAVGGLITGLALRGNVFENGGWSAAGSASAGAGADVHFNGGVGAGGFIRGDAGNSVVSGPSGSLDAGTFVTLTARTRAVDLDAPVLARGASGKDNGFIEVTGNLDVTTSVNATLEAKGNVTLTSNTRNVTTHTDVTSAESDIRATAAASITVDGKWKAQQDITATAGQNVSSTARGVMRAGRHVNVLASTDVDLGANVSAGEKPPAIADPNDGHIEVTATNGGIRTRTDATLDARAHVQLDAHGDIWTQGNIRAGQQKPAVVPSTVSITSSTGNVTTDGTIEAKHEVAILAKGLTGAGNVEVNGATASDDRSISATAKEGSVKSTAPLHAETFIVLDAKQDVTINQAATADSQSITATAKTGNVTSNALGDLLAATFVDLTAGHDVTLLGTVTAKTDHVQVLAGQLVPPATGAISTSDVISAGTFVHMTAPGDISVLKATTSGTLADESKPGDITIDAGNNVLVTGPLDAYRFIDIKAVGGVKLDASANTHVDGVSVLAKNLDILTTTAGAITAETAVTLDATKGKIDLNAPVNAKNESIQATAGGDITTAGTAPLTAKTFAHLLSHNGNVITHGSITTTSKDIDVQAPSTVPGTGDVVVDAPWVAGDFVLAKAAHDVKSTEAGTINAGAYVRLRAGNDINLAGDATAKQFIEATAGHDILTSTADLFAKDYIQLQADRNIDLSSPATAQIGFLQAYATHGDITTGAKGELTAGKEVDLQALEGKIDLNAKVTAGGFVQALARNDITTAAKSPNTPNAPVLAKDYVLLDSSQGSIITHDSVTATGKGSTPKDGDILADAAVDIIVDGAWKAYRDIVGTAGQNITTTTRGTLAADRHIELTATANDITIGGSAIAGIRLSEGHLFGTAGHDILTSGQMKAAEDVNLDAHRNITSGTNSVSAGHDIRYHAHTGDIATLAGAVLDARNDVLLNSDLGKIDLHEDVTGKRDVVATAKSDITTFPGAPVTATDRNVTLTSTDGSILTQDLVKAGADLLADAAKGDITLTGGWQSGGNTTADAGGNVNVRSTAAYGAAGLFKAGKDVAFTSTGALIKGNGTGDTQVIAGNDIGMVAGSSIDGGSARVAGTAGHDIRLALVKSGFQGSGVDKDQAAITLTAGSTGGPGSITDLHTFSDGSGAVGTASVVATGGGLNATATNDIDLGTQVKWVIAESKSKGDVALNEVDGLHAVGVTTANGAVDLTSGDTMLVRSVIAQGASNPEANATLHAYKNDVKFEDAPVKGFVKAADHKVTLTAANSVSGDVGWKNVISKDLQATAGGLITLGTDVDNVVSTSGGKTILHDFGSVTLTKVTTSGGDVDAVAEDALNVNTVIAGSGGGKNVHLKAVKGDIAKDGTGINVQSDRLDAEAGGGIDLKTRVATIRSSSNTNTTFDEQDAVTLERVASIGGDIKVTSGGAMTVQEVAGPETSRAHRIDLTSTGADITGAGAVTNVVGDHLTADAKTTIQLTTDIDTLTSTSGGNATFREVDSVGIDRIDSGGKVMLTANQDVTDPDGPSVPDVVAKDLDVTARSIELDTRLANLEVTGTGGDVTLREWNSVAVNRLQFGRGNLGNLSLSVGHGGVMTMNIPAVRTHGGNQTYTGKMELPGTAGTFTLSGNNVRLDASLKGGTGYDLVLESTGKTTVHQDVSVGGSISFLGDATIEFDPAFRAPGDKSKSVTVSSGGAAITFGKNANLIGMTQIISNGGSVTVGGALGGDSQGATASVTTLGGNVEFQKAIAGGKLNLRINTELATHLSGDAATDADKDNNGAVRFSGPVDVASVDVKAGNIYVMEAMTAETGDITLVPDNRMNVLLVGGQPQAVAGVPATKQYYASPKGHIELHGDLNASNGSIILGSELIPAVSTTAKPLTVPPTADGNPNPGIPSVATIVAFTKLDDTSTDANYVPIKLEINAKNEFKMFALEKMTVLGNVTINANHATLSDIAALGSLTVQADTISFATRDPSLLLTNADIVGGKADRGLDFFANDGIKFVGRIDGATSATGDTRFTLGVGPDALADVQGYRFLRGSERSGLDKFLVRKRKVNGDPIILDATANGASSTDISVTITQALPQETPKPTEDTNLSAANQRQLVEMGIYARNASDQEIVDRVSGRVVYLDVPPNGVVPRPEDYTVVAGKLPQVLTAQLIEDDKKLVDANSPDPEKAEPGKAIQEMLTVALAAFNKAHDNRDSSDRIDPVAFRTFLADGDYKPARDMLDKFDDLLHRVEVMGLTQKQIAFYREKLLKRIVPPGIIALDEMYDVIRAKPAPDRALTSAAAAAPRR